MKTPIALALMSLALGGVSFDARAAEPASSPKVRTLRKGATCAVTKPKRLAAKDSAAYLLLWNSLFGGGPKDGRPMPPPEVDFKKEMVLAAFMGEQNSGGYAVEIKDAVEEKGKLVVTVVERSPGPGSIVTQAITNPFHLVAVKRSDLPVQWKVAAATR